MKKTYLQPSTVMVMVETGVILTGSAGVMSNNGIGYGGVDEEGSLDPASRRRQGSWEDE